MAANQDMHRSALKVFEVASEDTVDIEAYRQGHQLILFKSSFISHISGLGDDSSRITLHDGIEISVKMDPRALRDKIYKSDFRKGNDPVDLLSVTGAEGFPKPVMPERMEIGQMVEGHGVYLGLYNLKDNNGVSLRKIFNIFAAPEDLPGVSGYLETVHQVAALKSWNGHDGTLYTNDAEMFTALRDGTYTGGWVVPPREVLGVKSVPEGMLAHQGKGALQNSFKTASNNGSYYPSWYWSSTEDSGKPEYVGITNFLTKESGWDAKSGYQFSCRPVRFVEVP